MKPIISVICLSTVSAILVPPPTGPYDVVMKVQSVTDPSRPADPFDANDSSQGHRRVLFSAFVPVERRADDRSCPLATVPYMTPKVAASYGQQAAEAGLSDKLFSSFDMQVCDSAKLNPCGGPKTSKKYPVLLFTPGLAESRLLYGAGARSLASQGYVVVTVDHPYEANFVEFPDGSVIVGRNISGDDEPAKTKAMQVRAVDLSYVIDQLHNTTLTKSLLGGLARSLDVNRLAIYAHSVGGGAAAILTRNDKRVLGGVDFDGQIVEPIRSQGLKKPFLLAGRYGHSAPNSSDPTWNQFWPHLTGPRVELAINGTAHGSYTDRPLLLSALGLPDAVLDQVAGEIGSVRGRRLETIVNAVLKSFFDLAFYKNEQQLKRLSGAYSEVSITRSSL